ncbi:MAG TPA: hypothetical protein VNV39_19180, partial [Stellaceae bacterium]|nr:hypothetical protein [Stellaceae bacterium]
GTQCRTAGMQTTIPFTRAECREVGQFFNAANPELLAAIEHHGGSAVTIAFLDFLGKLSGWELPPAGCEFRFSEKV